MPVPIISLQKAWKTYQMGDVDVNALRDVTLAINRGEFVAITGSSGSGKSTMMNLVGCLDLPTKGRIYLDAKDISTLHESELALIRGRRIGFIFQQFNLIPNLTALENVMLPLEFQDASQATARQHAVKLLQAVGLAERIDHLPSQLSGGQQQRVAIARALSNNPDVILADEPTGNLDSKSGVDVINLLEGLWKSGKTIVMVTHDTQLAQRAKRKIQMKDGQIVGA
ncbi:ABC transporter ATP-binding protein [Candidatus Woesearchaeota archaeon]|nr:ABC transporter ATP-binding protein [Candidatus Woesearchaeota archaeon]